VRSLVASIFITVPLLASPAADCRKEEQHGRREEARTCFQKLTASANPALRAEGYWGLEDFKEASEQFKSAVAREPRNADLRVRWGRLFLERFNKADAQQLFKEALEINGKHAGALLGMALLASEGFDTKAVEFAEQALEIDPKLLEAQELLARLAFEDNNPEKAIAEADKALEISPEALDAMAVRASIDLLDNKPSSEWMDRILKINPSYGRAWATVGHFFVLNRRYDEGIQAYRKALELNPNLHDARSQLGINLMRLGQEKEAAEQLEKAFNAGYQSDATVNSLRLIDSYRNFVTFKTDNTIVKLQKKEAELLKPYVEGELKRAIATFEKKYKLKLEAPVQVELYPNHEDFAVRTLGMPGLGALGVTFGNVVAMDSPSGRPPGTFHWASTLWHELSHVFVLTATKHRVPRWFTEGVAVHEETAASPDWGDRLDSEVIRAVQSKKLLPVARLDRGFIRPNYPGQVVVSYFQAGRICDYIAGKWGYDKLLDMMHSFGQSKSTPEVIEQHLGMKAEEFDKAFLAWLDSQLKPTLDNYDEWRKGMKSLAAAAQAGKHDEVITEGPRISRMFRDYVEGKSAYELVADAFLAKGDKENAMKQLEQYSAAGGRNPAVLKKLSGWQEEAGRKPDARRTLERLIYVYPMDEELHRRLGDLYLAEGITAGAIKEYAAVVASNPHDKAASRFNLARALHTAKRTEEAKEQLILALESAPGYRDAQKLLLELSR
jgi:tetratricopeptide (TPR) repeat protein